MNYPKPAPISKLIPSAVAAPGYHYVPQYSRMTFVVEAPKSSNFILDDDGENDGPLFLGRSGWKRTVLIVLIGALVVIILPQIIRMINRRR